MAQPVVADDLRVEVMSLEGGVVHVALGTFEEEKCVMVNLRIWPPIQSIKSRDVATFGGVKNLDFNALTLTMFYMR